MTQAENRNITNSSGRTVVAGLSNRRSFIGGSDARIIMGQDEKALIRLWQEKRGEVAPEDLSTNLIVQLGLVRSDNYLGRSATIILAGRVAREHRL